MTTTPKVDLPFTFTLSMGDESRDGHGIAEYKHFRSNKKLSDIAKSYGMAARMYSMALTNQCTDYEDSKLSADFRERALKAFHATPEALNMSCFVVGDDGDDEEDGYIDSEEFAELYLQMAKLIDPELVWEDNADTDEMGIGGYGLFSC